MTRHELMFRHQQAHMLDDPERQRWLPAVPIPKHFAPKRQARAHPSADPSDRRPSWGYDPIWSGPMPVRIPAGPPPIPTARGQFASP